MFILALILHKTCLHVKFYFIWPCLMLSKSHYKKVTWLRSPTFSRSAIGWPSDWQLSCPLAVCSSRIGSKVCLYYHTTSSIHKCVMAHERVGSVSVSCWGFGAVGNMIQQDIYTMPSSLCFTSHLHSECVESVWTHCRRVHCVFCTHSVHDPHRVRQNHCLCIYFSICYSEILSLRKCFWNYCMLFHYERI